MMYRLLLTAAVLAASALVVAPNAAATRHCGLTRRVEGIRYDVREVRGTVGCRAVRRVVAGFLRTGTAPRPWRCSLGHGSSPFAASCARGETVLVRVYAPM